MTPNAKQFAALTPKSLALLACLAGCAPMPSAPASTPRHGGFVTAGLGMRVRSGGIGIMPLAVLEDSRCPANVQCIQAGTVRIRARLQAKGLKSEAVIGLLAPYELDQEWVHLVAACPYPGHPAGTKPAAYRFTFRVDRSPAAPNFDGAC